MFKKSDNSIYYHVSESRSYIVTGTKIAKIFIQLFCPCAKIICQFSAKLYKKSLITLVIILKKIR